MKNEPMTFKTARRVLGAAAIATLAAICLLWGTGCASLPNHHDFPAEIESQCYDALNQSTVWHLKKWRTTPIVPYWTVEIVGKPLFMAGVEMAAWTTGRNTKIARQYINACNLQHECHHAFNNVNGHSSPDRAQNERNAQ